MSRSTSIIPKHNTNLILNLNEPLEFHINNFQNNNINWKKGKIRKLLYSIHDEKYKKDLNI